MHNCIESIRWDRRHKIENCILRSRKTLKLIMQINSNCVMGYVRQMIWSLYRKIHQFIYSSKYKRNSFMNNKKVCTVIYKASLNVKSLSFRVQCTKGHKILYICAYIYVRVFLCVYVYRYGTKQYFYSDFIYSLSLSLKHHSIPIMIHYFYKICVKQIKACE